MREKNKHDESLAETPDAQRPSSPTKRRQASALDKGLNGQNEMRDLVSRRAYEIYEERGRTDGEDVNDWLRAEAEVKASLDGAGQEKSDTAKGRPAAKRTGVRPQRFAEQAAPGRLSKGDCKWQ
jgi:hypothetical protein